MYKRQVEKKLAVVDLTASIMCLENKMHMYVFGLNEENSIVNALTDKFNGTKAVSYTHLDVYNRQA